MKRFRAVISSAALAAALAAFTGAALANPTPQHPVGNGNGNSANAPGHANAQPAHPAHPAHPSHPAKPTHPAHPAHPTHPAAPAHPAKPSHPAKPAKPAHPNAPAAGSTSPGNSGNHKITICHHTGSATNPYVEITVDMHALKNGHTTAKGDIIPAPAGGCPKASQTQGAQTQLPQSCVSSSESGVLHHTGSKTNPYVLIHPNTHSAHYTGKHPEDKILSGSTAAPSANCASAPAAPVCGSTVLSTIVLGVLHATGSDTNPFVLIHPNAHSAHMKGKHPEDKVLTQTVTTTTPAANCSAPQPAATPSGGASGGTSGGTTGGTSGGVLGVTKTLPTKHSNGTVAAAKARSSKPAGGVLGAATRIGRTLGATAVHGTLPFTGLPLWLAVLIAAVLVAFGLTLRRRGRAVL